VGPSREKPAASVRVCSGKSGASEIDTQLLRAADDTVN
jgi:hypothetical protein